MPASRGRSRGHATRDGAPGEHGSLRCEGGRLHLTNELRLRRASAAPEEFQIHVSVQRSYVVNNLRFGEELLQIAQWTLSRWHHDQYRPQHTRDGKVFISSGQ